MESLQRKKEPVLGFDVDLFSFEEAGQYVHCHLQESKGMQIVTINPEMIELGRKNSDFARILNGADLIIPDGVGVKIALKIKGVNQENIPGIEFAKKLISLCELEGYSVGLLGAKEEVVQKVKENLQKEHPSLNITYLRNGYFSDEEGNIIKEELRAISPKVVLVALGAPKQEFLISELREIMPESIFIGVGGSFDVWSGNVKRAPMVYRRLGLEWLYRTVKEPKRFKRIFPTLPMFLIQVIIETVQEKLGLKK